MDGQEEKEKFFNLSHFNSNHIISANKYWHIDRGWVRTMDTVHNSQQWLIKETLLRTRFPRDPEIDPSKNVIEKLLCTTIESSSRKQSTIILHWNYRPCSIIIQLGVSVSPYPCLVIHHHLDEENCCSGVVASSCPLERALDKSRNQVEVAEHRNATGMNKRDDWPCSVTTSSRVPEVIH